MSPEEFDKQYLAVGEQAIRDRRLPISMSGAKALEQLVQASKQKQYDDVIKQGEAVRRMYPEYICDANAYEFVAVADLAKGDKKAAVASAHGL